MNELIITIVAWFAIGARVVEAILQWWNGNKGNITGAVTALKELWKIIANFISIETYAKK